MNDSTKVSVVGETLETVSEWAKSTFGPCRPQRVIARVNSEMAELIDEVSKQPVPISDIQNHHEKLMAEAADVVIVLCQLAAQTGIPLQQAINKKMEINRKREWKMDGTGCGQHIEKAKA